MTEYFETFDETGAPLGLVARDQVHKEGIWHQAVNVFLFRSDGTLLIQRRSKEKDVCPNLWDLSAAEHLKPGEDHLTGAIRGIQEELGLSISNLDPLSDIIWVKLEDPDKGIKDYEIQRTFRGTSDAEPSIDPEEVSEIDYIELAVLKHQMDTTPEIFTPWFLSRAAETGLFKTLD